MRTIAAARTAAALLALASLAAPCAHASDAWSVQARSVRHSDALPLDAIDREAWPEAAPRAGRNLTYLDDELRLAWRPGGASFALLARQYATLVASADSLRLVAQVTGRQQPPADQDFAVDAQLNGFAGAGLALGWASAAAPGWRWQVEAQGLALGRSVERRIDGPVRYRAADARYGFDLLSTEVDNRLEFPFQQSFARRGQGLLLAAGAAWHGEDGWVCAELRDGGWLHWQGMPQQQATLSTATLSVDADGFLVYLPLVQGQNSQNDRTQWLPWRASLAAGMRIGGGHELGLRVETLPGFGALPVLSWQFQGGAAQSPAFGADWRLHERRLDLRASWRGLQLEVGADRLGAGAHSRKLAIGYTGAL